MGDGAGAHCFRSSQVRVLLKYPNPVICSWSLVPFTYQLFPWSLQVLGVERTTLWWNNRKKAFHRIYTGCGFRSILPEPWMVLDISGVNGPSLANISYYFIKCRFYDDIYGQAFLSNARSRQVRLLLWPLNTSTICSLFCSVFKRDLYTFTTLMGSFSAPEASWKMVLSLINFRT